MAAYAASQPELVTNGTFDTDVSGWIPGTNGGSISWSAGEALVENDGTSYNMGVSAQVTLEVGKTYEISVDLTSKTSAVALFAVSSLSLNKNTDIQFGDVFPDVGQTKKIVFVSTLTTAYIHLVNSGTGTTTWDNISVKQISSHAAIAPSDSARPTLASYNSPISSREVLTTTYGWNITDGGRA